LAVAHKCKNLVSATPSSPDPTTPTTTTCIENDTATVVISNCSSTKLTQKLMAPLLAATARATFGNPMPQYLNALTNAENQAIADTEATSIFIMEGADVANKRIATAPLTINLPDGKRIQSTHVCDIHILGLPTVLVGHIVPSLSIASLIGIRPLCKAGCTVTFDNEKYKVFYKGKIFNRFERPVNRSMDAPYSKWKDVDHPKLSNQNGTELATTRPLYWSCPTSNQRDP
jgi:hypothetical protein